MTNLEEKYQTRMEVATKTAAEMILEDKIVYFIDYVKSGMSKPDYVETIDIGSNLFDAILKDLSVSNISADGKPNFNYEESNFDDTSRYYVDEFLNLASTINNALTLVENGTVINGVRRPCNLLDYFVYVGMDIEIFLECLNIFLTSNKIKVVKNVFRHGQNLYIPHIRKNTCFLDSEDSIKRKTTGLDIKGVKFDTDDVKAVINFIKCIGPTSYKLFNLAAERYAESGYSEGTLDDVCKVGFQRSKTVKVNGKSV